MQQAAAVEPPLPEDIDPADLDAEARRDLRGLQKDIADTVARHLVAAGLLVEEDPDQALLHARFARRRASRIAVVREAAGIAAYHAGEWTEALGELRAARRMGGGPGHLAVMADIERALGRPERALELARGPEVRELERADAIELAIVAAGARRDLGELDAAVVGLQIPELDPNRRDPWSARLFYAYADNLLAAGRESDALQWFVHTVDADTDGETDADHRLADLTGEPLPDDGIEFDVEEMELPGGEAEPEVVDEPGDARSSGRDRPDLDDLGVGVDPEPASDVNDAGNGATGAVGADGADQADDADHPSAAPVVTANSVEAGDVESDTEGRLDAAEHAGDGGGHPEVDEPVEEGATTVSEEGT